MEQPMSAPHSISSRPAAAHNRCWAVPVIAFGYDEIADANIKIMSAAWGNEDYSGFELQTGRLVY